jgi:hypothetical protein
MQTKQLLKFNVIRILGGWKACGEFCSVRSSSACVRVTTGCQQSSRVCGMTITDFRASTCHYYFCSCSRAHTPNTGSCILPRGVLVAALVLRGRSRHAQNQWMAPWQRQAGRLCSSPRSRRSPPHGVRGGLPASCTASLRHHRHHYFWVSGRRLGQAHCKATRLFCWEAAPPPPVPAPLWRRAPARCTQQLQPRPHTAARCPAPPRALHPPCCHTHRGARPGHLPAILSSKAPLILADWAVECGPVARLRVGLDPLLLLTDPSEAARLLRRGPAYLPKALKLYRALEVGAGGAEVGGV